MSVKVEHLTKLYGTQKAVDDISFEVHSGEILGFLGPNGAGKSTTMKIITTFIPQTTGNASVCGFDVIDQPAEVRKKIGYLPENNPLYLDMYIKECLEFFADLHNIPHKKARVDEMIELTGLTRESKKKIGALSKGYRQRVGLAQAMIHNPEVLIMDEPTSGLDPNQVVEIRNLVKKIGQKKTVILSTHILQEVQALCTRVIIINKGELVANDTIDNLKKKSSAETVLTVEFKEPVQKEQLQNIKEVKTADVITGNKWRLVSDSDIQEGVFQFAVSNHLTILSLQKEQQSLEDIFRVLTK
jgi:ABC-2 type transport system ATP-binding protein